MTKPFVINPWMLDQVDRLIAYAIARGLVFPSKSEWGFLEGLRRADQDVDRCPHNWLAGWSAASRASLERAKASRCDRKSLPAVSLVQVSGSSLVSMHAFTRDASGNLDKKVASDLIETRSEGRQAWLRVADGIFPPANCLDASLRLGAAWWCDPPEDRQHWDQYCQSQGRWSEWILKSPDWDQWVWPWSNMIEQGLILSLHGKKPMASRFCTPEGWKDRRAAAWGGLGMKAWQSAVDVSEGGWEDMWIGLLCERLFRPGPSCD